MREPAERAYFLACRALGWLLRTATYARTRLVDEDGERRVHKRRRAHAPLLVWMGGALVRLLDTGVRVLPQREWEERERTLYRSLHGLAIRIDAGGVLVLPRLAGETLATLLDDPSLDESARTRAVTLAAIALGELHRQGLTHADAMAQNVLVDLDAGAARWFDFETVHDPARPTAWRRADDVRALLTTCLVRTVRERRAATLALILDVYGDADVARILAARLASPWRRPLAFHLAQAPMSLPAFRATARLLRERAGA